MKLKYALTFNTWHGSDEGKALKVVATSYSSYGGQKTYLVRNALGQWSNGQGYKKPTCWASAESALKSRSAATFGKPYDPSFPEARPEAVPVGPSDDQIRDSVTSNWRMILNTLSEMSHTSQSAQDLLERIGNMAWEHEA